MARCKGCNGRITRNQFKVDRYGNAYHFDCWKERYSRKKRKAFKRLTQLSPKAQKQCRKYGISFTLTERIKQLKKDSEI